MKRLLIFLLLGLQALCISAVAQTTTYPVQVNAYLQPPYSLYLSDYYSGTREKLSVTLINRDQLKPVLNVRLRMIITAPGGVRIQTNDNTFITPLQVENGAPMRLTLEDLAPYFQPDALITSGFLTDGKLPEGMVEFCFQAIEAYTGQVLSASTCTRAWITSQKPPLLSLPQNKESIVFRDPLNMMFQWTPRHQGLALVEYDIIIKELWDNGMPPQAAFPYSPEIYRETTRSTSFVYGALQPPLLAGKQYAWCVRAQAREGMDAVNVFQNDGYSEIRTFTIQSDCAAPGLIQATAERKRLSVSWDPLPQHIGFTLSYRLRKGETAGEWQELQSQEPNATIAGLQDAGTYEYRVASYCVTGQPVYSPIFEVTLPKTDSARLAQCGFMPNINLANQEAIKTLSAGDVIKASDYPVTITTITGGNGTFSGEGWTEVPWLNDAKIAVEFKNIRVNTDKQLIDGYIEAKYDLKEGQIANLDDVFEGGLDVGNVKTGLTRVDYDVDYSIPGVDAFSLNDDGELVIVDSDETPHTLTPADREGTGNDGNNVVVFPMTVKDKDGNVYQVVASETDAKGKPTAVKATQIAKQGPKLAAGSFDRNQLNGDKAIVTFHKGAGKYAFDKWEDYYGGISLIKSKYDKLYTDYYAPWKFLPEGQGDIVEATIKITADSLKPERVIFVTPLGTEFAAEYANGTYKIQIASGPAGDVQELYALYPIGGDKYWTLGKLGIATYKAQHYKVKLVPVNDAYIDLVQIQQMLKMVYDSIGVTWDVSVEPAVKYNADKLMENSTGLSTYNDAMRGLNAAYEAQAGSIDRSANYLFFLKATGAPVTNERDFTGFMPRGAQYGYIFTSEIRRADIPQVVAHELGHGRWKLYHPFDAHYGNVAAAKTTDNVMSYGNATDKPYRLAKWQWDIIGDPAMLVNVFEGDGKSAVNRSGATDKQEVARLLEEIRCGCLNSTFVKFLADPGMDGNFIVSNFTMLNGVVLKDLYVHMRGRETPLAPIYIELNPKQSVSIQPSSEVGINWVMDFKDESIGRISFSSDNKSDLENLLAYLTKSTQEQWEKQIQDKIDAFETEFQKTDRDVEVLKNIIFSIRCGFDKIQSVNVRFFLLEQISKELRIDGFDETVVIDILRTTSKSQAPALIEKLNNNTDVLTELDKWIHDEEYIEYHKQLQALFAKANDVRKIEEAFAADLKSSRTKILTEDDYSITKGLADKGIILWSDPGLIKFVFQTDFSKVDYEDVKIVNGKMSFHIDNVRWFGNDYDFTVKDKLKPFDPICVFVVTSSSDLFNPAAGKNSVLRGNYLYLPAISIFMLDQIETKNQIMRYVDVATTVIPMGLGAKTAKWGFVALESVLYLGQAAMDDYALELGQTEEGRAVLRAWLIVNVLYAVYDMSGGIDEIKTSIKNLRSKINNLPDGPPKARLEKEVETIEETLDVPPVIKRLPHPNIAKMGVNPPFKLAKGSKGRSFVGGNVSDDIIDSKEIVLSDNVGELMGDNIVHPNYRDYPSIDGVCETLGTPVSHKQLTTPTRQNITTNINGAYTQVVDNNAKAAKGEIWKDGIKFEHWDGIDLHVEYPFDDVNRIWLEKTLWPAFIKNKDKAFKNDGIIKQIYIHCNDGTIVKMDMSKL